MSDTVMRGFSEEYGSWNTIVAFVRNFCKSAFVLTGLPS